MGVVFRHEDLLKGKKKLLESGLQDMSPQVRESVFRILESWEGSSSEDRIKALVGDEKADLIKKLLKR